jgi:hypothetical protein
MSQIWYNVGNGSHSEQKPKLTEWTQSPAEKKQFPSALQIFCQEREQKEWKKDLRAKFEEDLRKLKEEKDILDPDCQETQFVPDKVTRFSLKAIAEKKEKQAALREERARINKEIKALKEKYLADMKQMNASTDEKRAGTYNAASAAEKFTMKKIDAPVGTSLYRPLESNRSSTNREAIRLAMNKRS